MSAPVVWSILLKTTMRDRQSFHKIHEIVMFCAGGFSSSKWIQPGLDSGITRRSQRIVPIHFPLWTVLKPKWYDYYTFGSQRERFIFSEQSRGKTYNKSYDLYFGVKIHKGCDYWHDTNIRLLLVLFLTVHARLRWQNRLFRSLSKTELEKVENLEKGWENSQHSQPLNSVSQGLEFLKVSVKTHV